GAGMMDCKKALTEADGDMEEAVNILRKSGSAQAAKKANRVAAEGSTFVKVEGDQAVLLEVNCETDFVVKNETFQKLTTDLADHILENNPASMDEVMKQTIVRANDTVEEYINSVVATSGEKITFRRFELLTKTGQDLFGAYLHMGGSIGSLVVLEGTTEQAASKDVVMHVAAVNPSYVSRDEVPEAEVNAETEILKEQALNEGKPEKIVEKMVEGRLGKFIEGICLLKQDFVKYPDKKVKQFVEDKRTTII